MRMQAGRSAYVPAALKRGKGRTGDSVFVQKMPVDPMNPKTLLEASCAYWCGAVRTSTASGHIGFAFPRVPTLTVISPICLWCRSAARSVIVSFAIASPPGCEELT